MKATVIRLSDDEGKIYRWTIKRVPRAINCVGNRTVVIAGWEFRDHDDYPRFAEGNWRDLVNAFRLTANNYGFHLLSHLD